MIDNNLQYITKQLVFKMYKITKRIEFDMGHRIPQHDSKCKNLHGHRYIIEAEILSKELINQGSKEGMVEDFGDIKQIMMNKIHNILDHGFMMSKNDNELIKAFGIEFMGNKTDYKYPILNDYDFKLIVVDFIPTAENIAKWCFEQIKDDINIINNKKRTKENYVRELVKVRIWETPNSIAEYSEEQ